MISQKPAEMFECFFLDNPSIFDIYAYINS